MSQLAGSLRALALDVALGAADILRSSEATGPVTKSSPTDIVTDADRAAEGYIFDRLRRERPRDSILSEEGSAHQSDSGITWVIDPLDGTINFIYGIPQWSVSIGIEGSVRAGVIVDVIKRETFTDADPLQPSTATSLQDSLIGTGFAYSSETRAEQAEVLGRVLPRVRDIRRFGSCALDLAWVACGRLDGFYEVGTNDWDVSAGIAIIEAVGGAVSRHGSLTIAAGTSELLGELESLVLD